ncbi:oxidoreductase [Methylocella silvestris]|uniref:Oxidoreductase n=1 Tax=Methylocella silvestris TaxID=199596 RepID=A0A2J7TEW5_METSI|nr:oxidoreductase [Methylocella silvestris]
MTARGVAFVTGASSGIGRAVALRLASQGFTVAVSARRAAELEGLAAEHERIVSFPGDVVDRQRMAEIVKEAEAALGPIVLAFLNHGVYFPAEREGFDADVAWRSFEVNVGGVINCLAPLLAAMEARGRGQIAITASLAGYGGVPGSMAYGASKAALIYMAEVLRMTYEPRGLKIQIVNPGFVATQMTDYADFDMPFLMSVQTAADIICKGLEADRFEIAFPRRLALFFKAARLLPYPLLLPLMRRAASRAQREG